MNSLYNTALRQSRAIHADLDRINAALDSGVSIPPNEIGAATTSLNTFTKAIEDYHAVARQEIIPKKQEEAMSRVKKFKEDLSDYRTRIDIIKKQREEAAHQANRADLLGRRPYATSTPENPYAKQIVGGPSTFASQTPTGAPHNGYGAPPPAMGGYSFGSGDMTRENHALQERNWFSNLHDSLDGFIAQAQGLHSETSSQNALMKSMQSRLYSAGNTLGVSHDTMRMIERRAKEDKWIFAMGAVVFFLFCWTVLHYLH